METIPAKTILQKNKSSDWFGNDYNMNLYKGCCHGCIYCDSRSECYGIEDFDTVRKKENALEILRDEKAGRRSGGIYHKIQIDLTYNSNHIEGSRLTHDQTRYIYETNTIGMENGVVNVDDVVETANHFRCIDMVIRNAEKPLSEALIKKLHFTLKSGTSDSRKDWFAVGEYKKLPNEVGGKSTTEPELVAPQMKELLSAYNQNSAKSLEPVFNKQNAADDAQSRQRRFVMEEYLHVNPDDLRIFRAYVLTGKMQREPAFYK